MQAYHRTRRNKQRVSRVRFCRNVCKRLYRSGRKQCIEDCLECARHNNRRNNVAAANRRRKTRSASNRKNRRRNG